jgi:hypothetical protein
VVDSEDDEAIERLADVNNDSDGFEVAVDFRAAIEMVPELILLVGREQDEVDGDEDDEDVLMESHSPYFSHSCCCYQSRSDFPSAATMEWRFDAAPPSQSERVL